jgi:hypothetical protein
MSAATITIAPGAYLVTEVGEAGVRGHVVTKDKACTCGGSAQQPCPHIDAVEAYLRRGGARAPAAVEGAGERPSPRPLPEACPICGSAIQVLDTAGMCPLWRCRADSSHYWRWRGERMGVRAFLTRPHPNKVGAWYGQTAEQREAFLAAARERMSSQGYAPNP